MESNWCDLDEFLREYVFPEMKDISAQDEVDRLRTALMAIISTLSEESIRQLMFLLHGNHGSSPRAVMNLITAHLQTPMRDHTGWSDIQELSDCWQKGSYCLPG